MAWMARLDARAARWATGWRWLYLGLKWFLVVMGAYCLVGNYVLKWGWMPTLWFLGAPLIYGLARGLSGHDDL